MCLAEECLLSLQLLQVERNVLGIEGNHPIALSISQLVEMPKHSLVPLSGSLIAQLALVMVSCLAVGTTFVRFFFRMGGNSASPMSMALAMSVFAVFLENTLFSVLFVDGSELVSDTSLSGRIIGMQKTGTACGTCIVFIAFQLIPDLWRTGGPRYYIIGFCLQVLGALAFSSVGFKLWMGHEVANALSILNSCRFLQGVGGGLQVAFGLQQTAFIVKGQTRTLQNTRFFLGGCLGMGMGPLMAAGMLQLAEVVPTQEYIGVGSTLAVCLILPWIQLPALSRLPYEPLRGADEADNERAPFEGSSEEPDEDPICENTMQRLLRQVVILECMVLQVLRSACMAAVEAAFSELLISRYGWTKTGSGLLTALLFFSPLFTQVTYERLRSSTSTGSLIRWLSLAAFFGGLVLKMDTSHGLLFGSFVILPCMSLSSGLIMGTMQEHAFSERSWLGLTNITLASLMLSDLLGRGVSPMITRSVLTSGGQTLYANSLTLLCILSFAVNETLQACSSFTMLATAGKGESE